MDIHRFERHFAGEFQRHHDHPGNPEENDVEAGHQHAARVEGIQFRRVIRPAEGGEGPQCGAEPGVENIVVLAQWCVAQAVFCAHFCFTAADVDLAGLVIPGRDAMAPPQLAGNAPVLQVAHPGEIHVLVLFWHELDAAVFHRVDGRLRQCFHRHEPLVGEVRFNHHAGTVAARHHQLVVDDLLQQAEGIQVADDLFARHVTVHAAVGLGHLVVHGGVDGEQVDHRQVVALADVVVIEVVRGRDLDAAGAEVGVDIVIADNRDLAVRQRQADHLADHVAVARVFRVYRHGGIAEHGFRARGGDHKMPGAVGQRVAEVPHVALFFLAFHFQIGNRGVQCRVPVDQALAAIDQAFFMQTDEGFLHGAGQLLVHRETFARPVQRGAQATHLARDSAAGFGFPFPDFFDEGIAAEIVAGLAFGGQAALHHHLRGDAGVVGAGLPEGVAALHPAVADQRVHHRVVETMAHVQRAGYVRGRHHDAVGLALALRGEIAGLFPALVPALFDGVRLVGLVHGQEYRPG